MLIKIRLFLMVLCLSLQAIEPTEAARKQLVLDDYEYESNIRTVMLYPFSRTPQQFIAFPIMALDKQIPFKLEFDELGNYAYNYFFKIIHCNADWTQSSLSEPEYLSEMNEFRITEYEASSGTRVPYVHYNTLLPRLLRSGNYVVVVYRNQDIDDIVLSRRFILYENQVIITPEVKFSNVVANRYTHQQVDFKISYGALDFINPGAMIKVIVRQNGRWDNAISDLKPLYHRVEKRQMDFQFFEGETNFTGDNEFRMFDMRSVNFIRQNITQIDQFDDRIEMYLRPEKPRNDLGYIFWVDIDGRYVIEDLERGGRELYYVTADYIQAHFELIAEKQPQDIYIFGQLSNWKLDERFKMKYDGKSYKAKIQLKQGFYNYMYATRDKNGAANVALLEGTHYNTQNQYDILVYYRPMGGFADEVVGYAQMNYIPR
jgi:hypothetical protein